MPSEWSVPESEVLASARDVLEADREAVLATVVDIDGSAYRRPGAKMLITPEGGVGSITAGCLEDEVQRIAQDVLEDGRPRIETYDLMEDDDDVWGLGVGCNGIIDILLEPLDDTYEPALDAYERGEPVAVISVLGGGVYDSAAEDGEADGGADADVDIESDDVADGGVRRGVRGYYHPGSGVTGLPDWLASALEDPAAELLDRDAADTLTVETDGHRVTVFVEGLTPPPELVVLGTGHDVGPVVELAKRADFRVTVVGFRGANATEERFPEADAVLSTSAPRVGDVHDFDERTYAVVMTHNFVDDRLAVDALLDTQVPYVGLLGPRERFEEMLEEFEHEGRTFTDAELDRVYTPAGLDLGGGTPYQIGLSIVSEVIAVHNDRTPQHLKAREGHIHDRIEVEADD